MSKEKIKTIRILSLSFTISTIICFVILLILESKSDIIDLGNSKIVCYILFGVFFALFLLACLVPMLIRFINEKRTNLKVQKNEQKSKETIAILSRQIEEEKLRNELCNLKNARKTVFYKCPYCGSEFDTQVKACTTCGAKIVKVEKY